MRPLARLFLCACVIARAAFAAEIMFTAEHLGLNHDASALNNHGEMAGEYRGTIQHGILWDGNAWVNNGLSGSHFAWSSLSDINDNHLAVGLNTLPPQEEPSNSLYAVRVHLDAPFNVVTLGSLTGEHGTAKARAINNQNIAVGESLNSAGKQRAVRFETNGIVTDLGTLGGDSSTAVDINDAGVITGDSRNPAGFNRGFILGADGIMRDIGTLGGDETFVEAINNRGEIVGQSFNSSGQMRAFIYANGKMTDLGTLGGANSVAYSINDDGVIVGAAMKTNSAFTPFINYPGEAMQDLAPMVQVPYPDRLLSAKAINNRGSIIVQGSVNASNYLLKPGALTIRVISNVARLRFAAPGETAVLIERSQDLKNWTTHASIAVVSAPFNIDFVLGRTPTFFRAKVTLPN